MTVPMNPMRLPPRMPVQSPEASYALNRRSEDVIVKPIIVPELELRNVGMQVLLADVVGCADDAALDDAPKTLNRIGVNRADTYWRWAWSMVTCG